MHGYHKILVTPKVCFEGLNCRVYTLWVEILGIAFEAITLTNDSSRDARMKTNVNNTFEKQSENGNKNSLFTLYSLCGCRASFLFSLDYPKMCVLSHLSSSHLLFASTSTTTELATLFILVSLTPF